MTEDETIDTTDIAPEVEATPERVTGATYDFSDALRLLKEGHCLARQGWNGKNQFVYMVSGSTFQVNRRPLLGIFSEGFTVEYLPHLDMWNAQGKAVPWLASQGDLFADDWQIVDR
jgi:Protein of unknown function (DUF2829)